MPLLFPKFRINQVFGANTEVGKTLLTTALVRASATRLAREGKGKNVFYLKPVSTGPDSESDVAFVDRHTGRHAAAVETHNLYQYREPMSPHLAARLAPDLPFPATNDHLVRGVEAYAHACAAQLAGAPGCLYVETAGGVHSPALHPPHTQSTALRPLLLPAVLVAAPHLGGISTTISAYESLLVRGYTVSAVLCLHDAYYRNDDFLAPYFAERGIGFWDVAAPPEKRGTAEEDADRLGKWYDRVERAGREDGGGGVAEAEAWIEAKHVERVDDIMSMPRRTLDQAWWPFTQHGLVNKEEDVMVVDSAHGDNFDAFYARPAPDEGGMLEPYFDGSASWFTQSHGHASETLTLAAAAAAGRYGHVLYPSGTHAPALRLTEKLLATVGTGWADRVFYSDNGSTGVEVALKMALRASGRRYGWDGDGGDAVGVIGLRGGYHGDTIGAMDATQASTFNRAVDWYKGRGHWFSPPAVQFRNGQVTVSSTLPLDLALPDTVPHTTTDDGSWQVDFDSYADVYDLPPRLRSPLADAYRAHIRDTVARLVATGHTFGALVLEPTCLGAGGMVFVDPLFQACMVEVVRASADLFAGARDDAAYAAALASPRRAEAGAPTADWAGLPVIYDEVFSGLHRFGYHSASDVLAHAPDIAVYAKILTGGLVPLSATLASRAVFGAFLSDRKVDALLHGHSYTANPVGCAVALAAIDASERREAAGAWDAEKRQWAATEADGAAAPARWSFWSPAFVARASEARGVRGAMAMGTVLAVELDDGQGYSSHAASTFLARLRARALAPDLAGGAGGAGDAAPPFAPFRIHSRPLGNVIYIMTSLYTPPAVVRAMERAVLDELARGA